MSVVRKVRAVERVFAALDIEIRSFQKTTQINCLAGCGKCCFKPDIEATPLEFLPLAFDLFLTRRIDEAYAQLANAQSYCLLFAPKPLSLDKGSCSQYVHRGLICRLFGYSAMKGKNGEPKYVTCKIIKESQPEKVAHAQALSIQGNEVPMMSDYYFRIRSIDPDLGTHRYPINEAIRKAIEYVMAYYAYRRRPSLKRKLIA
ncbi:MULTISPECIES: YkgJ family cysteine cluster protein [Roseivirga]|uniref:YkgJ family cysteine cluster protein n=1 Tax=Roseivirga TaxID=290180 RepID=UPI00257DB1CA|nr:MULTISPECIES: YkgJ family cysteine cluster protein [Roseivirga]MEC7755209.1 YkgJ family cysteine cluster protein [Bacteroidota bacterium]|tara:strand:+ start:1054 stop:1659 length:606 start_codon:yes stop_codon:yes gene_type:complete